MRTPEDIDLAARCVLAHIIAEESEGNLDLHSRVLCHMVAASLRWAAESQTTDGLGDVTEDSRTAQRCAKELIEGTLSEFNVKVRRNHLDDPRRKRRAALKRVGIALAAVLTLALAVVLWPGGPFEDAVYFTWYDSDPIDLDGYSTRAGLASYCDEPLEVRLDIEHNDAAGPFGIAFSGDFYRGQTSLFYIDDSEGSRLELQQVTREDGRETDRLILAAAPVARPRTHKIPVSLSLGERQTITELVWDGQPINEMAGVEVFYDFDSLGVQVEGCECVFHDFRYRD